MILKDVVLKFEQLFLVFRLVLRILNKQNLPGKLSIRELQDQVGKAL